MSFVVMAYAKLYSIIFAMNRGTVNFHQFEIQWKNRLQNGVLVYIQRKKK